MLSHARPAFRNLVAELRPWISRYGPYERDAELVAHMACQVTQTEVCIRTFLRMMAGGAVHEIFAVYWVSPSMCHKWFRTLPDFVCKRIPIGELPADERKLGRMAVKSAESRLGSSPLPACVGALDGIQVTIEKPHSGLNPLHFYGRKGFYALIVQATMDSDYRVISCSSLTVGSTHEALAFRLSSLSAFLEAGKLPKRFLIAGIEAFRVSDYTIIPFSLATASLYQDSFNFYQSSHRLHV